MSDEPGRLDAAEDRRRFLQTCGRFAATVPPAITIMLSTSLSSEAIAKSAGGGGGGGAKGDNGGAGGPDAPKSGAADHRDPGHHKSDRGH